MLPCLGARIASFGKGGFILTAVHRLIWFLYKTVRSFRGFRSFSFQKITASQAGIFSDGLQKLWLRHGRETKSPLHGEAKTEKAGADPARTFSA